LHSYNGNYYEMVDAPGISWLQADEEASAMAVGVMGEVSGHLVTITSEGEQDFLDGVFGDSLEDKWFGGFQVEAQDPADADPAADWYWVTGEPWDYTKWAAGEANDGDNPDFEPIVEDGEEQYLMGWPDQTVDGTAWNDGDQGVENGGYVVEYEGRELLTGKATFGFVAKYKKGATTPTGQTEFVFHSGGLNFHSSSYDWLVVTGSGYARFKGVGTVNGEGPYKFMLWAGDGDPDTFRIKIWKEDEFDTETVIYDNGFEQAIGGGSIVIHKK
jgi:hypothetical protein